MPTILDEVGSSVFNYVGDGINFLNDSDERSIFWHYPHYGGGVSLPASAVRCGNYKLIYFYETKKYELYNLKNDIGEHFNLVKSKKKKFEELREKLDGWLLKNDAKFPTENTSYNPKKLEDFLKMKFSKKK